MENIHITPFVSVWWMFDPSWAITLGAFLTPEGILMSMFVALTHDRRLNSIEDAQRGLACACVCVSCGEPVIARKGELREHHFAHHSNKESCFIQRETILHLYGKQVIREQLGLQLPLMPGVSSTAEDTTSWWDLESVELEVPQAGFQPDIVAQLKDGSQLFIEVAVTSFVDEVKLGRIKASSIKTVEIDLNEMLHGQLAIPSKEMEYQILHRTDNKKWVYPEPPAKLDISPAESGIPTPETTFKAKSYTESRFTIKGMWLSARILQSGSVAVRSMAYNPEIVQLLKQWRCELGGEYNEKYRNWIFYPHAREIVLDRLKQLDES